MARPKKEGLDYFPLDVDIDQNDKIALVEAKHGVVGFSVIVKLLMKIYKEGYFYSWTEKEQLLFSKRINVDINSVNEIVNDCLEWDLFDNELFLKFSILTSEGIQERYLDAITRRKEVHLIKDYLLISPKERVGNSKISINYIDVNGNRVNVNINSSKEEKRQHDDVNNPQSKVKESKVKESKVKDVENEHPLQDGNVQKIMSFWDNNGFGYNNTHNKNRLLDFWYDSGAFETPTEIILKALELAAENDARTYNYVAKILNTWKDKNLRTIKQVLKHEEWFKNKTSNQNAPPVTERYSNAF